MDPDTCLREYWSALERRDFEFCDELWHNLRNWVGMGGFLPEDWEGELGIHDAADFWSKPHLKEQP